MKDKNNIDIYKAFSNENRVRLMVCLSTKQNVTDLLSHCNLSQSALSQHLKILKESGFVVCKREGKKQVYGILNKKALKVAKLLLEL